MTSPSVISTDNSREVSPLPKGLDRLRMPHHIAVIMDGAADLDPALFTRGRLQILREAEEEDGVDRGWKSCTGLLILTAFFAVAMWAMGSMVAHGP